MNALVVCVGNSLVGDDAAGCAVYESLVGQPLPPGVRVEYAACGGMALLERLRGEPRVIVVDAVAFGAPPGTVHVLGWDDLPCAGPAVSAHGVGLREAIEVARLLYPGDAPRDAVLVGIEGRRFGEIGGGMSTEVETAVDRAAGTVRQLLRSGIHEAGSRIQA